MFCIFQHSQNKWPKSEEKLTFAGRLVLVPMNPSPLNENFVAVPLPFVLFFDSSETVYDSAINFYSCTMTNSA